MRGEASRAVVGLCSRGSVKVAKASRSDLGWSTISCMSRIALVTYNSLPLDMMIRQPWDIAPTQAVFKAVVHDRLMVFNQFLIQPSVVFS